MIAVSGSIGDAEAQEGLGAAPGAAPGHKRSQFNSKWSVPPAMTWGRITNSDRIAAMAMAAIDRAAERIWFGRVTNTISTKASSGSSRMVNATVTIVLAQPFIRSSWSTWMVRRWR